MDIETTTLLQRIVSGSSFKQQQFEPFVKTSNACEQTTKSREDHFKKNEIQENHTHKLKLLREKIHSSQYLNDINYSYLVEQIVNNVQHFFCDLENDTQ